MFHVFHSSRTPFPILPTFTAKKRHLWTYIIRWSNIMLVSMRKDQLAPCSYDCTVNVNQLPVGMLVCGYDR